MAKSADAFRTISEVSDWLETPAHVLRFWESRFTQVKPVKRAGGRRYYRPNDMLLLGGIKKLLHEDGLSIKQAQQVLRDQGVKQVSGLSRPIDADQPAATAQDRPDVRKAVDRMTARDTAPLRPHILSDVPAAANSPKPVQPDLFSSEPAGTQPESTSASPPAAEAAAPPAPLDATREAVEPEVAAMASPAAATAPEVTGRLRALRAALISRPSADADALRPHYERLRALRAKMDVPLAGNNEK